MKDKWKPNLFIPGFPKCGTTALASYLAQHKDIYVIESKEPRTLYHWNKAPLFIVPNIKALGKPVTMKAYRKAFEKNKDKIYRVDASQDYSFDKDFVKELYRFNPKARIILMIREQEKRLFSAYNFTYPIHKMEFDKWIDMISEDLETFFFKPYLEEIIKYYGKENVLVIEQIDLLKKPKKTMKKLFEWLGLENDEVEIRNENTNAFSTGDSKIMRLIKANILNASYLFAKPITYLARSLKLQDTEFYLYLRARHPSRFIQKILAKFKAKGGNIEIPANIKKKIKEDFKETVELCKSNGILLDV